VTLIDEYSIKARQVPALVAIAPMVFAVYALFPELQSAWGALGGVLTTLGGPAALAYVARGYGKRLEPDLFKSWGGKPTTTMLRWSDDCISTDTKRRYHKTLRAAGVVLPSADDEANDPVAADAKYESAGEWMLRKSRDTKKYPFVFTQNINYGFARNLLGLRPLGLSAAAVCSLAQFSLAGWDLIQKSDVSVFLGISIAISVAGTSFWLLAVRPGWVQSAAVAYSRALLEICDHVDDP